MPKIGYARANSSNRDRDIQIAEPTAVGCEVICSETVSGVSRDVRSELGTVIETLGDGDEFVVQRLGQFGQSTRNVPNLVHKLDAKGASLRVLELQGTTAGGMAAWSLPCWAWWPTWNLGSFGTCNAPGLRRPRKGACKRDRESPLTPLKSDGWHRRAQPRFGLPVISEIPE